VPNFRPASSRSRTDLGSYNREFARPSEAELILPASVAPLISRFPFTFFLSAYKCIGRRIKKLNRREDDHVGLLCDRGFNLRMLSLFLLFLPLGSFYNVDYAERAVA